MCCERPPCPDYSPPPGFTYAIAYEPTGSWRLEPADTEKICRQPKCKARAVASLNRKMHGSAKGYWWTCCADHMYGRWVENGRVAFWRMFRVVDLDKVTGRL